MSSMDLIVFGLCAAMILIGITVIRASRRNRGMGAIGVVLGVVGLVAYLTAEEGAHPPDSTQTATLVSTPSSSTPERQD